MCTVTFLPRATGFCLAMNRDEQLARVAALAPLIRQTRRGAVLGPAEPGGGMWVSVNDRGAVFALINWYSIPVRVTGRSVTRGRVVAELAAAADAASAEAWLRALSLERTNPFRLIGVFPATRIVREWRWNLKRVQAVRHGWRPAQWASSGWNEAAAQRARAAVFAAAARQATAGSTDWLRRLHQSHRPERGPRSICMHRDDAATVSYTEIIVTAGRAAMRYHPGPPCATGRGAQRTIALVGAGGRSDPRVAVR
jgi:hypothetical protein